jgi:hypothetical protein
MTETLPLAETAQAEPFQPGVYDGMPDDLYHGDPVPGGSLSASGARKLLPPSCPALYRYEQDHGRPPKREFDLGHAAHREVLGVGLDVHVVDARDWKTTAARAEAEAAREAGKVPLLAAEYDQVKAMAAKLREHPVARALFDPERGKPEQSAFWRDERTGIWRRARLDWLPNPGAGRLIVPDYKTSKTAAPDELQRSIRNYGWDQQSAWYLDAVHALNLADDSAAFVFVVQQKTPPYLVTVVQLDVVALQIGRFLNKQAIDVYAECTRTGRWPGFSDDVEILPHPPWVERQFVHEQIW